MSKLAWVLLPLAAMVAWLALCAWRGRLPSRPTLNVLFSLLLLAYVAGTAGLGVFWVANQQLPVFDWHYTFGYATVLALVVHLGFNLRIVWHHLTRLARRGRAEVQEPARPARSAPSHPAASARAPGTGSTSATGDAGEWAGAGTGGSGRVAAVGGRRPLLGLGAAAALAGTAGLGYFVGLRHGRTELHLSEVGATAPAAADAAGSHAGRPGPGALANAQGTRTEPADAAALEAWAVVERFHAFSGHSRARVLRHAASTDWGAAPPPFKRHPGRQRLPLPAPAPAGPPGAGGGPAGLTALSTWLWHTAGISERRGGIAFRTSPSSGALFATELYVLAVDASLGLVAGSCWHYEPDAHALQRLPDAPMPATLALPVPCRALVVASAVFARSGHKYGDRTYRYVLADLGHALENLRGAVAARGDASATLLARFDESALAATLSLDERQEGVLAALALAPRDAAPPGGLDSAGIARPAPRWASAWRTGTAAGGPTRLGLTEAVHRATSLRAAAPNEGPLAAARPSTSVKAGKGTAPATPPASSAQAHALEPPGAADANSPAPAPARPAAASPAAAAGAPATFVLPPARAPTADVLALIARRRSQRRYANEAVPLQALADILGAMTSATPQLSRAVRIDVVTPGVAGLPPAAWRVEAAATDSAGPGAGEPRVLLLRRRVQHDDSLRRRARAAALDQDVIGDAAVVFVLSLDRAMLRADPAGAARGYRHGFIEAGLVGERIYLAAGALGLGTCAVGAFYDDEAAALVGLDSEREWPVHFAALGVPA